MAAQCVFSPSGARAFSLARTASVRSANLQSQSTPSSRRAVSPAPVELASPSASVPGSQSQPQPVEPVPFKADVLKALSKAPQPAALLRRPSPERFRIFKLMRSLRQAAARYMQATMRPLDPRSLEQHLTPRGRSCKAFLKATEELVAVVNTCEQAELDEDGWGFAKGIQRAYHEFDPGSRLDSLVEEEVNVLLYL